MMKFIICLLCCYPVLLFGQKKNEIKLDLWGLPQKTFRLGYERRFFTIFSLEVEGEYQYDHVFLPVSNLTDNMGYTFNTRNAGVRADIKYLFLRYRQGAFYVGGFVHSKRQVAFFYKDQYDEIFRNRSGGKEPPDSSRWGRDEKGFVTGFKYFVRKNWIIDLMVSFGKAQQDDVPFKMGLSMKAGCRF